MTKKTVCKHPFTSLEINHDGSCHFCCPAWTNHYCIGNIFNQSADEVWNGEKAQKLRKDVLELKYSYCNTDDCFRCLTEIDNEDLIVPYPEDVRFSYDYSCAQTCIMCRDEVKVASAQEIQKWDEKIETSILPLLKNAKIITLNGAGEFSSPHSKKLVKRISQVYPDIKFSIISNGMFLSKENLKQIGIIDKLVKVEVSIHAATEKTYNKIVRNSNFKMVKENVEFLADLKKQGQLKDLAINFVIHSINYKEMKAFAKWGESLDSIVSFWPVENYGDTKFNNQLEKYSVFKPTHPEYNSFVRMLQDPIFKSDFCVMTDFLKKLKPVSNIQILKNKLQKLYNR